VAVSAVDNGPGIGEPLRDLEEKCCNRPLSRFLSLIKWIVGWFVGRLRWENGNGRIPRYLYSIARPVAPSTCATGNCSRCARYPLPAPSGTFHLGREQPSKPRPIAELSGRSRSKGGGEPVAAGPGAGRQDRSSVSWGKIHLLAHNITLTCVL
jgi:hypothetical protein